MQKVGGGKLTTNQRLVDLNKVEQDADRKWLEVLDESATDFEDSPAFADGHERGLYESLAGRRA